MPVDANSKPIAQNKNAEPSSAALLIATDFSDNSLEATLYGFRTASLWGSAPHVAHVAEPNDALLSIDHRGDRLIFTPDNARSFLAQHVDGLLEKYRETAGQPSFGVAMSHVLVGDPAQAVSELARELDASLIIVGTSRNTGAKRWLLGSTAERIVRMAACAVTIYRPRAASAEATIDPACPACLQARTQSKGQRLWCAQHEEEQARRHTYHYRDKNSQTRENMPLLFPFQR